MSNLKPFPPGVSGNPAGRPRKFVSQLREQGYKLAEVNDTIQVLISMSLDELKAIYENPKADVLEKTVAAAIKKGIEKGSLDAIETLLSRVYGKPAQSHYVSSESNLTFNGKPTIQIEFPDKEG